MSDITQLFTLSSVAQLFTLFLAVFGAFYKNTQKKHGDHPVYWHGFPVLTLKGWILVIALLLSSAISIYSAYDKGITAEKEKAAERKRADELQQTLNQVSKVSASSLELQITRFEEILMSQAIIGETTIGKIDDSSTRLATNLDNSSARLNKSINTSANNLIGNISDSSALLRANILDASLGTRSSIPKISLYVDQRGVTQDFADAYNEVTEVKKGRAYQLRYGIGVIPKSIRDVLFPFADNSSRDRRIGWIRLNLRENWGNLHEVRASGIVGSVSPSFNTTFTSLEAFVGSSQATREVFWLTLNFDKEWSWQVINESLKTRFSKKEYVMIIYREGVAKAPPRAPAFTRVTLVVSLSHEPPITIVMPLEVKNYAYDARNKSYKYELHISKAPEIRTDYLYQQEP